MQFLTVKYLTAHFCTNFHKARNSLFSKETFLNSGQNLLDKIQKNYPKEISFELFYNFGFDKINFASR